jgi:hypothetical protein
MSAQDAKTFNLFKLRNRIEATFGSVLGSEAAMRLIELRNKLPAPTPAAPAPVIPLKPGQ